MDKGKNEVGKNIVRKTAKRKDIIVLPGNTKIYQPNRVARGKYKGFSLLATSKNICNHYQTIAESNHRQY